MSQALNKPIPCSYVPVRKILATRLRSWRLSRGLTLKAMAVELGVSPSLLSDWEHARRFPQAENIDSLVVYMKIQPCYLLYIEGSCQWQEETVNTLKA